MGQRCLGPCGPSAPAPVLLRPLAHLHWGHLRSRRARVSSSRPVSPPVSSAPREHRRRPSCSEAVPPGGRGGGDGRLAMRLSLLPAPFEWHFKGCELAGLGCLLVLPAGRIEPQPRRPAGFARSMPPAKSNQPPLLPSSLSP